MEEPDSTIIAASRQTPDLFGVIFDRHSAVVLRFLARRVDPSEAEGLLGEVFRIAFERRASFDLGRESARPWLYGIAANIVAKHRRSEARRLQATVRAAAQRIAFDDPAEIAVSAIDARARWSRIADAISELPAPERQTLLLFAWEELSYQQIAEVLDLPTGTVRSRLNRARAHLSSTLIDDKATGTQASAGYRRAI